MKRFTAHPQQFIQQLDKKIRRDIVELNNIIKENNQINVYRMFYPVTVEYMFCSCALRTHAKISHTLSYKTKFNKFERIEVIQCVFSDYNGIKLGINNKEHWKCVAQHTSTG